MAKRFVLRPGRILITLRPMNTSPATQPPFVPQIRLYQQWLAEYRQLHFDDYQAMWHWSVTHLEEFWQSAWDYLDLQ